MSVLTQQFQPADFTGAEEYALEVIEAHRRQIDGIREWLTEQGYSGETAALARIASASKS